MGASEPAGVKYEDVIKYKKEIKSRQKRLIGEIMELDEGAGLYDT